MEIEVEATVDAVCPECGHKFTVTAPTTVEVEPDDLAQDMD